MSDRTAPANPIRAAWESGVAAVGTWVLSPDPVMAEATAAAGFDWICIDTQHGWISDSDLPHLIQVVALAGATPIVRVPSNEPWLIGRALDAGALGVMVPMVGSPAEAERAVRACRHQPAGLRSAGTFRASPTAAASHRASDREVVCIVQLESRSAIETLDGICATPGLDAVYIGPTDLALSLGLSSKHELPDDLLAHIRDVALAAGVYPAMHGETAQEAIWALEHGFRFTTAGADVDFLYAAAESAWLTVAAHRGRPTVRLSADSVPRLPVGTGSAILV